MENYEWRDISGERQRTYIFPHGEYTINDPVKITFDSIGGPPEYGGGSHRVLDARGMSHYIPRGWVGLNWIVREGKPEFAW